MLTDNRTFLFLLNTNKSLYSSPYHGMVVADMSPEYGTGGVAGWDGYLELTLDAEK